MNTLQSSNAKDVFRLLSTSQQQTVRTTGHRSRLVGINRNVLADALLANNHLGVPTALRFNLFDDVHLVLHTRYIEPLGNDGLSWSGSLLGAHHIDAFLTILGIRGGIETSWVLAGNIRIGQQRYSIESVGVDLIKISEQEGTPTLCGTPDPQAEPHATHLDNYLAQNGPLQAMQEIAEQNVPVSTIRILAAYPSVLPEVTPWGAKGIGAKLYLAATITNDVFSRSKIPARVEIIYREVEALKTHDSTVGLLHEVAIFRNSLYTNAPARATINTLREELKADIVLLLSANDPDDEVLGFANTIPEPPRAEASDLDNAIMAAAMMRGERSIIDSTYVLAHELGHLMGAKHARQTMPNRADWKPMYDHVRGYEAEDGSFGTVMSYSKYPIPYFSDADMQWESKPIGVPYHADNAASAAPFLRSIAPVIASYRSAPPTEDRYLTLSTAVSPDLAGTVITEPMGPYTQGTHVVVTAIPRGDAYRFSSWRVDGKPHTQTSSSITFVMNHNHTLTADFDAQNASIAIATKVVPEYAGIADINIYATPATTQFVAGTDITFSAPRNTAEYAFISWRLDGSSAGTDQSLQLRPVTDHVVEAVFAKREYKVIVESVPATVGIIQYYPDSGFDPENNWFLGAKDQHLTFSASAREGQTAVFQCWRIDGQQMLAKTDYLDDLILKGNTRVEACFEGWDKTFRINASACIIGQDIISQDIFDQTGIRPLIQIEDSIMEPVWGYSFLTGTEVFFETPYLIAGKYRFVKWLVDGNVEQSVPMNGWAPYLKIIVSKDVDVQARFELV